MLERKSASSDFNQAEFGKYIIEMLSSKGKRVVFHCLLNQWNVYCSCYFTDHLAWEKSGSDVSFSSALQTHSAPAWANHSTCTAPWATSESEHLTRCWGLQTWPVTWHKILTQNRTKYAWSDGIIKDCNVNISNKLDFLETWGIAVLIIVVYTEISIHLPWVGMHTVGPHRVNPTDFSQLRAFPPVQPCGTF